MTVCVQRRLIVVSDLIPLSCWAIFSPHNDSIVRPTAVAQRWKRISMCESETEFHPRALTQKERKEFVRLLNTHNDPMVAFAEYAKSNYRRLGEKEFRWLYKTVGEKRAELKKAPQSSRKEDSNV
jgi:hypothetical protein